MVLVGSQGDGLGQHYRGIFRGGPGGILGHGLVRRSQPRRAAGIRAIPAVRVQD
jgi:hypothetical protein